VSIDSGLSNAGSLNSGPLRSGYSDVDVQRWVGEASKATHRSDFARDRARVLHSAALRRLAAKTQVVQAGELDFPRTRLTHSLECAQIGREIGTALGCDPDLVEVACLAHDLGHPPFGHNGEAALDRAARNIGGFEGNAQSLRLLTRLEAKTFSPDDGPRPGASVGLNLTRATLDAATKYPWLRADVPNGSVKFGVYDDDVDVFRWVRGVGVEQPRGPHDASNCIEAQIMDWADDVAYSVHDVEDAVHGGYLRLDALKDRTERRTIAALATSTYLQGRDIDEVIEVFERLVLLPLWPTRFDGSLHSLAALKSLTSNLIGRFCTAAQDATREAYGGAHLTRYAADLVVPDEVRLEVGVLKSISHLYVFERQGAEAIYAEQQELIGELVAALAQSAAEDGGVVLDPALRPDYVDAVASGDDEAAGRVIIDQVAILTDRSARQLHRLLLS